MKSVAIFVVFLPSISLAQTPSFDCRLATRADEIAICSDPQLSELEKTLADAYQAVKDQQGANVAKSIGTPILTHRRKCGSDTQCIYDVFQDAVSKYQEVGVMDVTPTVNIAPQMNDFISQWQDANARCRDAEGADDLNQQCGLRDEIAEQLNTIGLCQASYMFDSSDFKMATILREHWVPCVYTELLN